VTVRLPVGDERQISDKMTNGHNAMRVILPIMLAMVAVLSYGQVQTYYVRPAQTDPGYDVSEDSSAVSRNTASQTNKLVLFLGGTGSSPSNDYNALRLFAVGLGFDFINLSYPNNVAAASLANDPDPLVFDKYRQEACFGTPVSDDVAIDSLNSIHTRAVNLLLYLDLTYPADNWGQYLATSVTLDWSRIIVGGHSQGSGHACYLAKQLAADRVLMFAGPNDYSDLYMNAASWTQQAGATPVSGLFSYLSLNDEVVAYEKQAVVISALGMLAADDSTHVDDLTSPYGNSHCLYTTQPPGSVLLNHNVPIMLSTTNTAVWTYMLTAATTTSITPLSGAGTDLMACPSIFNISFHLTSGDIPAPRTAVVRILDASGREVEQAIGLDSEMGTRLSPGSYVVLVAAGKRMLHMRVVKE